jgi:putative ABC transport system permease protein
MLVDLLHLSRNLRRSPASAGAAILTLTLTLGAGASIFAVVHAVLLTPPPFENPDALVVVGETPMEEPTTAPRPVGYDTFEAWRQRAGALADLEAVDGTNLTLTELGAPERLSANDVTPGFLTLLGVTPALGRAFERDDVGRPVAILSHGFWRGKLAADPTIIGRSIVLGGQSHTIVGVLPEKFLFELNPSEVWRPLPLTPAQAARAGYRVSVVARLATNATPTTLGVALDDVSRTSSPPARAVAIPVATAISGGATRTLGLLAGAAALAILIAFINFAGLLIVRSIDRRHELAVRSALGARRFEIARQLLLEAQALVAMGTVAGVVLALWMTPAVGRLALEQFGSVAHRDVAVSWQVMAVVAIAASACAWACALVPALMAARRSVLDVLRRGATPPPRELIVRRLFVTGEVALAFVLLACVTLLGGGLLRLLEANPGFDARGVLALQVSVPAATYSSERVVSFYSALQGALEERLGPRSTAIVNEIPLAGSVGRTLVRARPSDVGREAVVREAGPAYFDVMRIPIAAGRSFESRDNASAPPRIVISASLVERLFAFEQPVGRHIWLGAGAQMAEIIGVVDDVKHRALDEAFLPTVYLSALQAPSRSSIVVVRSARPDADVTAAVREEVGRLDGSLPVYSVRSMQDVVAASPGMPARRVLTATFIGFALLALVLAAIGLFGVVAHDVASRRAELALRIALGADPRRILGSTLWQGAVMVGSGLAVGGVLSIWAARALGSVGFGTDRLDALSVGMPATVLIIAGVAAVLPAARRAARTDPLITLRSE